MFKQIDEGMLVSPQLRPEALAEAKAQGVAMIVNNRPDGEEPGQPTGEEIEAAAKAAGIAYRHIPIRAPIDISELSGANVRAMGEALAEAGGKVLAFCKSGTRSTFLWALARAEAGEDAEALTAKAGAAGYDLTPLRPLLG